MTTRAEAPVRTAPLPLLRAAHIGPALAVTAITALLCGAAELSADKAAVVTGAVLTGQLTIGWGNDLLDMGRDRLVGRPDKPLATGELSRTVVLGSLVLAGTASVVLSLLAGWRSGVTHLALSVLFGHLYNLGLKRTLLSWLPYAVAFGALPAVVTLAGDPSRWPPLWMVTTAGALGVAAHFLNALPDFDDDAATGVHGLPHRLGAGTSRALATALLVCGSAAAVLGPPGAPAAWAWVVLAATVCLALLALLGQGKVPFRAAIAIALIDVGLLTAVAS